MGFLSNIKNMVTGGGADVILTIPEVDYGQDSNVNVSIKVKDAEIKSEELYLELQCNYHCNEMRIEYLDENKDSVVDKIKISLIPVIRKVDSKKRQVNSARSYRALSTHEFPVKLMFDKPDFISSNNQIVWKANAGLAVTGNDPDSGWKDFNVKASMNYLPCYWNITLFIAEGKGIKKLKMKGIAGFYLYNFEEMVKILGNIIELDPVKFHLENIIQGHCQNYLQNKLKEITSGSFNVSGLDLLNYIKNSKELLIINNSILINYLNIEEVNLSDYKT